jgi:magnesium chelatase family protein
MDRIDLQVTLMPVTAAALIGDTGPPESSAEVLKRVVAAREAAAARWRHHPFEVNADAPGSVLRQRPFRLPAKTAPLTDRLDHGSLSARGLDRILRVAWTIADLDGRAVPRRPDIEEALQLRTGATP